MRAKISLLAVCLFSSSLLAADEVFRHGLRHTLITNAMFSTDPEEPLSVINTGYGDPGGSNYVFGTFGASIHLGETEGVIVSIDCESQDTWAMQGLSYGTVSGLSNSLIGTVTGTRIEYGRYEALMDFSPIGATSYTYQLFFHGLKTLEVTNAGPASVVDVSNSGASNPRINPIWLNGGRVGVIVDFGYPNTDFYVPGFHAYATRMIILAEMPSNIVEQVSRIDVFGHNGLPSFTIQSELLGKFGLYHQTLGDVRFHATPSQLTVSNIDAGALEGMLTELPRAQTFRAHLLPLALTNENCTFVVSASAMAPVFGLEFIGDALIRRESNVVSLIADFGDSSNIVARILSNGVLAGTIVTSNKTIGTVLDTNLVLASYAAATTQTNEPAYVGFRFANALTVSNETGTIVTGDEIRVSGLPENPRVGPLAGVAFTAQNLDTVTLTGVETFVAPPEPLRLNIAHAAGKLRVSWRYDSDFNLVTKSNVADLDWRHVSFTSYTRTNFDAFLETTATNAGRLYQLRHDFSGFLFRPVVDP